MATATPTRPWAPWYGTQRWKRLRAAHLIREPLCRMCLRDGRVTAATVVDHITPHKGNETLFWEGPFQSLCKIHHDASKSFQEARGYVRGSDGRGNPLDPEHHWNRF